MVHVEHERRHRPSRNSTIDRRAAQLIRRGQPHSATDLLIQPGAIRTYNKTTTGEPTTPADLLETRKGSSRQSGTIKPSEVKRIP